jgi:hypothetical protein
MTYHMVSHYLDGGPPRRKFGEWSRGPHYLVGNGYCHCRKEIGPEIWKYAKLDFLGVGWFISYDWIWISWFEKLGHGFTWIQVWKMLTNGRNIGVTCFTMVRNPLWDGSNKKPPQDYGLEKTFPKKYIWV